MKLLLVVLLANLLFVAGAMAEIDVKQILKKMDELYRSDSSYAKVEMEVVTPHWKRTLFMDIWTMGMKKTFVRIVSPQKDAGISTLRRDQDMWNYFPKIDKVIKVPPSMMMGSWMGSDFTNDDLVKESTLLDDYTGKLLPSTDKNIYNIELIPRKRSVSVWGKIELKLQKDNFLPVREIYYNERGEKARMIEFSEIKQMGTRRIPVKMVLTPLKKEGNQTMFRYKSIDFDVKVPDSVFTRRNLQRRK